MPSAPLFQLHIPKTGGTTLFETLAAQMGREGVWQVTTESISPTVIAERTAGLRMLAGHLTWATVLAFTGPCRVLTVIRDPFERALSVYGYFRENADSGIFAPGTAALARETRSRTLSELILDRGSGLRSLIGPVQVGYLSSHTRQLRLDTSELMPDGDLDAPRVELALESALRNLDSCWWVGTTETLDRDISRLRRSLGWSPLNGVPRHNATAQRADRSILSGEASSELERLVAADLALHERARHIAGRASAIDAT